jgi:predicted methyltransferase
MMVKALVDLLFSGNFYNALGRILKRNSRAFSNDKNKFSRGLKNILNLLNILLVHRYLVNLVI